MDNLKGLRNILPRLISGQFSIVFGVVPINDCEFPQNTFIPLNPTITWENQVG